MMASTPSTRRGWGKDHGVRLPGRGAPGGPRGRGRARHVGHGQALLVQGADAEAVLNRVCANDVAVPVGRIVYTQWLNEAAGIIADLTVTRLGPMRLSWSRS